MMKKIGILFMIMALFAVVSIAQPRGGQRMSPEDMAKRNVEAMKENVGLDKDQEKKVYDIGLKYGKKMQALREEMGGGGFNEGMREKFAEMREEQNKEMKKVLNEKQWEKYEKYQEERRSRMRERGQGRNR